MYEINQKNIKGKLEKKELNEFFLFFYRYDSQLVAFLTNVLVETSLSFLIYFPAMVSTSLRLDLSNLSTLTSFLSTRSITLISQVLSLLKLVGKFLTG